MSDLSYKQLFPTKLSLLIFILYILLFVSQGILVTASQEQDNKYDYNIVTVVLLTEVFKLVVSASLYCKDKPPSSLLTEIVAHKTVLALYFVPSLLYCLYNNLSFVNLSYFDPTTYYLLLQLRVVVTGVLFQIIFKKSLSKLQWLSLLILTVGCMLKQINFTKEEQTSTVQKSSSLGLSINAVFIFIQIFCSCFAGVYNEYIIKKHGADVDIFVQNVFMYLDSIVCNLILLILNDDIFTAFTDTNLLKVFHFKVFIVMVNNTAIGIVTSFFLKTLNSILKTFASALELVFTAVFSSILFSIPIYLNTVLSIVTVMFAVYLYSQNPVSNLPKPSPTEDATHLLKQEEV